MKIAIIGSFTMPSGLTAKDIFTCEDGYYFHHDHPHPWIANLAQGLAKIERNKVHVITMLPQSGLNKDKEFTHNNVTYHLLRTTPKYLQVLTLFESNKWKIHKLLNELKPDIVHGHSRGREGYWAVTCKFPNLVTNHGQLKEHYAALLDGNKSLSFYFHLWNENRISKKTKYFIAVSPNCYSDCKRFLEEENIALIDNPVEEIYFHDEKMTIGNYLLYIGSINNLKRILELIKAVKEVDQLYLKLIYHAVDNIYLDGIKKYIEENKIKDRIIFLGYKPSLEITEELKNCLALCLPSKYESFGLVLAEAMASGKPVIAANVGGIPYVVEDGFNGLLWKSHNVAELSNLIRKLVDDREYAKQLGENGRKTALERWHPDSVADKTFEFYKKVIANK